MTDNVKKIISVETQQRIEEVKKSSSFNLIRDQRVKKDVENDLKQAFELDENILEGIKQQINSNGFIDPETVNSENFKSLLQVLHESFFEHKEKLKIFDESPYEKVKNEFNHFYRNAFELLLANSYLENLDSRRSEFLEELYKKMKIIAEMTRGTSSLGDVFGRFWDLSYHELYNMDMDFVEKLYALLKEKAFVKQIAELLGRLASSKKQMEEKLVEELKYVPNSKKTFYSPSNMVGITTGNNIPDVLPHALALRKRETASYIFKKQFAEKQLAQFDKKDKTLDSVKTTRTERTFGEDSKGPFVIVIDTSGSMHGEPEKIAKAMALSLIDIAQRDSRQCFIVNFSTTTVSFDASKLSTSWNELYRFLSQSFGGGTDIDPAVVAAVKQCEEKEYKNADVIFISDLIINSLAEDLRLRIAELQKNRVRFHALTIGRSYNESVIDFLDNNWVYDGTKESIDKIISDLYLLNSHKDNEEK